MMRDTFEQSASDYYETVRRLRRVREFDSAVTVANEALKRYPDNAHLTVMLGNIYRDKRQDETAMDIFQRAFVMHPREQVAVMGFANFLTVKHHYGKAENIYAHMFALNGANDMRLLTALGHMYQCLPENALAAACFGKATLLPKADDYARSRYEEICTIFRPGYRSEEWENVLERMAERKEAAMEYRKQLLASMGAPSVQSRPAPRDLAGTDQPFYDGPSWS